MPILYRGVAVVVAGALIAAVAAVQFAPQAPAEADQPKLIEVDCLQVERGPVLRFEGGRLLGASGATVGTYRFQPAAAGKRPRIEVQGVTVRRAGDKVLIEPGKHAWIWTFQSDDTVEIFFYPQDRALAHRCTS